jgi:hypothetical protein
MRLFELQHENQSAREHRRNKIEFHRRESGYHWEKYLESEKLGGWISRPFMLYHELCMRWYEWRGRYHRTALGSEGETA